MNAEEELNYNITELQRKQEQMDTEINTLKEARKKESEAVRRRFMEQRGSYEQQKASMIQQFDIASGKLRQQIVQMNQEIRQRDVANSKALEQLKFQGLALEKEVESRVKQIAELATHADTLRFSHYQQIVVVREEADQQLAALTADYQKQIDALVIQLQSDQVAERLRAVKDNQEKIEALQIQLGQQDLIEVEISKHLGELRQQITEKTSELVGHQRVTATLLHGTPQQKQRGQILRKRLEDAEALAKEAQNRLNKVEEENLKNSQEIDCVRSSQEKLRRSIRGAEQNIVRRADEMVAAIANQSIQCIK